MSINERMLLKKLAEENGYKYFPSDQIVYGTKEGYSFTICVDKNSSVAGYQVLLMAFYAMGDKSEEEIVAYLDLPSTKYSVHTGGAILAISRLLGDTIENELMEIEKVIKKAAWTLLANNYFASDVTGSGGNVSVYAKGSSYFCYTRLSAERKKEKLKKELKKGRITGYICAFLGSLLAAVVLFFILRLGSVNSFAALVMGGAIVYGYKLGKGIFTKSTVVVCTVMAALVSGLTYKIFRTLEAMYRTSWDFKDAFLETNYAFKRTGLLKDYYVGYIMVIFIAIVSALTLGIKTYRKDEDKYRFRKVV
jgi:hypothetical protein